MAKKSTGNWRAQQLAAYKTLAVMAGSVGGGASIAPVPKYTAMPSSRNTARDTVQNYWGDKNNTGLSEQITNPTPQGGGENQNKRSVIAKVLDALSVGAYATAGAASAVDKQYDKDSSPETSDVLGAGVKGLVKGAKSAFNDEKKTTWADVINDSPKESRSTGEKVGTAAGGLALDIFADPLTYVPGVNIASAINKIGKGSKAGKRAGEFFQTATTETKFNKGGHDVAESISGAKATDVTPTGEYIPTKFGGSTTPKLVKSGQHIPSTLKGDTVAKLLSPGEYIPQTIKGAKAAKLSEPWAADPHAIPATATGKVGETVSFDADKAIKKFNHGISNMFTGTGKSTATSSNKLTPSKTNKVQIKELQKEFDKYIDGLPQKTQEEIRASYRLNPRTGKVTKAPAVEQTDLGVVQTPQELISNSLPRQFADAPDSVGTTARQAAESAPTEVAAKLSKDTDDVTNEIINLAKVQHNAKNTNPALNTGTKFADWASHAKAGDYSVEQLQPFMDYHKVDNVDDLVDTMKGKNYKATQKNIRAGMRETARKDIKDALPGSAASVADKMSDAGLQAEKLVEGSLDGIKPDLVSFSDPALAKTVDDAIKRTLDINVRFPARSEKIKPGVHRRTSSKDSGVTYLGSNNIMDQSTAGSMIMKSVVKHFTDSGRKIGPEEVDLAIAALKRYEQTTSAKGMFPHIGSGKTGLPLGLSDILTALPKDFVRKYLVGNVANQLNYKTLITTVGEALKTPVQNADAMRTLVKETVRAMEDGLSTKAKSNALLPQFSKKDGTVIKNKQFVSEEAALDEIADNIANSMNNITEASINASKLAKVDIGNKIHAVSEGVIKSINDALTNGQNGKAIDQLLNSTDAFRKEARGIGLAPAKVKEVVEAAQKELADDLNLTPSQINDIENGAKVTDEMFEPIENILDDLEGTLKVTTDPRQINKVKTAANDAVREEFQDGLEMAAKAGGGPGEIGDVFYDTAMKKASGFMQGLGRAFNGNYGMGNMAGTFHKGEQSIRAMTGQYAAELTKLQKQFPKEQIAQHFTLFRQGQVDDVPQELKTLFNMTFESGKNGRMARAGILPDNFTFFAQKQRIDNDYIPKYGADNPWEDVKVPEDVLPYMKNLFTAQLETMKYSELGKGFSASFGRTTKPGSDWFKPKTSSMTDLSKNQLSQFIDPNKYYSKEMLDGLSEMNRFVHQMDRLGDYGGDKMNTFMTTVKKITGKWKLWQTVVRPGHHVKNQVGDMTLTFLAGHTNPDMYDHAMRMLTVFDKQYRGLDGLAKRMDEDLFGISADTSKDFSKKFKWGKNEFSYEEMHSAAMQENILTSFMTAEDLSFSGLDKNIKAAKNPITKTFKGVEHFGGTISEYRDKHVRLSHFFAATRKIAKKNPSWSKSKVYGAAGSEVRRWHPNGTGLSPWENKYAKVGIMFYSWQRQVLPLMLESLALKPGRVTVAPKAMYAIAEANGVDLDSFGNPFPADNIYPNFLQEEPYGPNLPGGLGFKPGIPQMDFLGDYGTPKQAGNTAVSSINPLVKAPIEFMTGTRMGVGENIPISDKSEYIDSNIPLASYLNNATGRSLSSGFTQPTKRAEEDRQTPIGRNLANLLLGGGITDYNDPKFQEIAERDLKEREGK